MASSTCFNYTFMGVIGSYVQMGGDIWHNIVFPFSFGVSAVGSVYDRTKNKLGLQRFYALRLWYGSLFQLQWDLIMGVPVAEFPSGLLPITLWTLPMVTGILNWNS